MNLRSIHFTEQEVLFDRRIDISFILKKFRFGLVVFQDEFTEPFSPVRVYHQDSKDCPFCERSKIEETCSSFSKIDISDVFHALIEQPSIRLEWLFIPHT